MKPLIFAALLAVSTTALADHGKASKPAAGDAKIDKLITQLKASQQKNPLAFCYLADKAYSEGAVAGGSTCARPAQDKLDDSRGHPLVWVARQGGSSHHGSK
jgi:hypothetical protein